MSPAKISETPPSPDTDISVVEATISDLRHALDQGWITSVELVSRYLHRIAIYDRRGKLNSMPVLNLSVFEDAAESDQRRIRGLPIRPLEGIPFTVKDSYKVKGLTVASGSPAFKYLIAQDDAFTVEMLREAGAILIGKTNMPPMAAGGMQRGCYGRAESPYNKDYLAAAFASGSSNGSAVSTAASFAAFGMAEETVSSGRSPASNNGLVAYTPSRGLISIRGNWPLYPTCDVVVPHTRTVRDLFQILDIIVVKDDCGTGDFWREQSFVTLPEPSDVRPKSFDALANSSALRGKRIGVPKIYIEDSEGLSVPITTRQSIIDLWHKARVVLEKAGATVVETDLPLITNYDTVSSAHRRNSGKDDQDNTLPSSDGITKEWSLMERRELVAYAWDDFLRQNGDPSFPSLSNIDPSLIFPQPPGSLPDQYTKLGAPIPYETIVSCVSSGRGPITSVPGMEAALNSLEARRKSFECWLETEKLDCIVFPANADVGLSDADVNESSAEAAWKNGVMYSNGNRVIRHLGIPTVTIPMGIMADTQMPVGLTFAGKGYDDGNLLEYGFAYEEASRERRAPKGTPGLKSDLIRSKSRIVTKESQIPSITLEARREMSVDGHSSLKLSGFVKVGDGDELESIEVTVDGRKVPFSLNAGNWGVEFEVMTETQMGYGKAEIDKSLVIALVLTKNGRSAATMLLLD